jgi:beta-glucanase (GH16 family)
MPRPLKGINQAKVLAHAFMILIGICLSMPSHAGWQVQWIDQFDGSGVNWNNWTAQTQANYNNEVQCYTDDDSSATKNYDVSGGTLKIIARRQNINCPGLSNAPKEWTSGRLNSKDKREFLYGRIESRIRFENEQVLKDGTWPAFWMLENRIEQQPIALDNDNIGWPNPGAGEIDVWEWSSKPPHDPTTYITNFYNGGGGCGVKQLYDYPGGASDVQEWHDYAIEWDANAISFYIDDTLVGVTQDMSGCAQYEEPMFVLLNVAMGGDLGGTIDGTLNKVTMEVAYVAHCVATTTNTATSCNESTPKVAGSGQIAPVIISAPGSTAFSDNLYSYTLIAFDGNGDTLTMSAPVIPDWLSFNSASGLLSGTPGIADEGAHSVTLKASDGAEEATQTFTVSVSVARLPGDLTGSSGSVDLWLLLFLSGLCASRLLPGRERSE